MKRKAKQEREKKVEEGAYLRAGTVTYFLIQDSYATVGGETYDPHMERNAET